MTAIIDEIIRITLADTKQLKDNAAAFARAGMLQYVKFTNESIRINQEQLQFLAEERKHYQNAN